MSPKEFENLYGFEPVDDDIERATCDKAGQPGHHFCGVCPDHHKPRFVCGCDYYDLITQINHDNEPNEPL